MEVAIHGGSIVGHLQRLLDVAKIYLFIFFFLHQRLHVNEYNNSREKDCVHLLSDIIYPMECLGMKSKRKK